LGDPLSFTRSPELHRAGLETLGLEGSSEALRTSPDHLAARLAELAAHGYRGVNLTHPLKECVLPLLARVSEAGRLARSVNTVGFESDGWWGDTTDGPGFVDWLGSLGRDSARQRVVLLGGGGAARSLALALVSAGSSQVAASLRGPARAEASWSEIPEVHRVAWRSAEEARLLRGASLVVNATPLAAGQAPLPLALVPRAALLLDLVYGPKPTPWVLMARAEGREAYDGLGLLVFQARRSLALWYASAMPVDSLARAVGWPR
jgi:shikimate dehydrogenase